MTPGPGGQVRSGSLGGEAACPRPPKSQPQCPPGPRCPSLDHPPSACPQGGVHLPGQGPPLYPGTRQRQVTPDHNLRPEPWALSSLTPRILLQPPAQEVSGQPCGWSGGVFVSPGSEGSPGWSAPLSCASPTPVQAPGGLWDGDPLLRIGVRPPANGEADPAMGSLWEPPCRWRCLALWGWGSRRVQSPGPPRTLAWDAACTPSGHQG